MLSGAPSLTGTGALSDMASTSLSDGKSRKEAKEAGGGSEGSGGRAATADKVSPPRCASGTSHVPGERSGTGTNTPCGITRQPTASPARQASKLPVAELQGVRKSASSSVLTNTACKPPAGAAEAAMGPAGGGGTAGQAGTGTAAAPSTPAAGAAPGSAGHPPVLSARALLSGTGTGMKEGKRASISRVSVTSSGGTSITQEAPSAAGPASASYGHGVVRRTGNKAVRGTARSSTGSTVAVRRRGGATSPMPQRVRLHGVDTAGRLTRGGAF